MQLNDTRIQEYGRNDGVQSVLHCQDKFYPQFSIFNAYLKFIRWQDFCLICFEEEANNDYDLSYSICAF